MILATAEMKSGNTVLDKEVGLLFSYRGIRYQRPAEQTPAVKAYPWELLGAMPPEPTYTGIRYPPRRHIVRTFLPQTLQMRPKDPRPTIAGPPTPSPPFPIAVSGPIVKGFGRGSAELGIPTANIPLAGLSVGGHSELESGVYYGWAGVAIDVEGNQQSQPAAEDAHIPPAEELFRNGNGNHSTTTPHPDPNTAIGTTYPMVMSLGFNPYYKNTVRSIEVHLLHTFAHDFYGARMNLLICGFIRPEYDYVSKEALVEDIRVDIEVARRSLEREGYLALREAGVGGLRDFGEMGADQVKMRLGTSDVNG